MKEPEKKYRVEFEKEHEMDYDDYWPYIEWLENKMFHAEQEIERLRGLVGEDVMMQEIKIEDGVIRMGLRHSVFQAFIGEATKLLLEKGGKNYLGLDFHSEHGDIEVVIRYADGETPASKAKRLDEELSRLRALVQVKKEIRLPTFEECKSHLKDGLTALEVFIYDNEPAGTEDSERFREQLLCALREVLSLATGKE